MIKTKTLYRVPDICEKLDNPLSDLICGVWCTDKFNMEAVEHMRFCEEVLDNNQFECISGKLIDDSLKDCLFFTFLDKVNYGDDFESKYVEITWDELISDCDSVEVIMCE